MKKSIITSIFFLLLTSCVSDYKGDIPVLTEPKVVVNCVISPDNPISMSLKWSKVENEDDYFDVVRNAVIQIREDGELIIDEICADCNYLIFPYYPKYGSRYELQVTVPDYGEVTASTSIPAAPYGDMEFKEIRQFREDNEYYIHVELSNMKLNSPVRALWLVAKIESQASENTTSIFSPIYYYPDTYEIDQVNVIINSFNAAYSGTVVECEGFIRVPKDIVEKKDWINLSFLVEGWLFPSYPSSVIKGGRWELERSNISRMAVDFIAPSDEYDRYCRSVAKQYYFRYDPDTPFLNENVVVQGNITNGLGVFAGYAVHRAVVAGL